MKSSENVEEMLREYQLSPTVQKLNDYYKELSFLDILRVERKENYHSNFLKWIFEDQELNVISVKRLLFLLLKRQSKQKNTHFPDRIKRSLLVNSISIEYSEAKLEDPVNVGGSKGRSDILISIKYSLSNSSNNELLYVVIENKVKSDEHDNQTQIYYEYYKDKFKEENCIFVFLTPLSSIELNNFTEPQCKCKKYIQINYQDLLDEILEPLSVDVAIQERKRFIIKEYIKGLSMNYSQKNCKIMAIEPAYRNLLVDFWKNNEQLIVLSLEALKSDSSLDAEIREAAEEAIKGAEKISVRDKTHYKFDSNQCNGKGALVSAILTHCIEKEEMTFEDINGIWNSFLKEIENFTNVSAVFDGGKDWTYNDKEYLDKDMGKERDRLQKFALIYSEQEYNQYKNDLKNKKKKDVDHDYSNLMIGDTSYYCYNQWGWKNIDFIIKFYRDKIKKDTDPDIEVIYE